MLNLQIALWPYRQASQFDWLSQDYVQDTQIDKLNRCFDPPLFSLRVVFWNTRATTADNAWRIPK